jgi:hypothetical protein
MFSFAFLTLDLIIILVIFIAGIFISFAKGEYILARFLLTFYPATLFYLNLPFVSLTTSISKIIAYVVIYAAIYYFLKKNFTTGRSYKNSKRMFDSIILALSSVIIIMTIYYHIIPLNTLLDLNLPFSKYLTNTIPLGVWMITPIIALIFTHKHNA